MKTLQVVWFAGCFAFCAFASQAHAGPYDNYIWQAHITTNLEQTADVQEMIQILQREVDLILNAGHLAPLRFFMTDTSYQSYWLYYEPGRIIATLAMAYPYLTQDQKARVRTYINDELGNADTAIWSSQTHLAPMTGHRREPYSLSQDWSFNWFWGMDGQKRPRVQTLYGLWLYAFLSADWQVVHNQWDPIKNFYNSFSNQGNIYGTMSAHLAMARMAYQENDTATMNQAVGNAEAAMALGFDAVETNKEALFSLPGYNYGGGSGRSMIYTGFQFLNLVPEMGHFLNESSFKANVLAKHAEGKQKFPFWWVRRSPNFTVWAGEEGIGAPPELIGMMFPIERFVAGTAKENLYKYFVWTARNGIGDCYVLEALVYTIQAFGTDTWVDIRTPGQPTKLLLTALPSRIPPDGASTSNMTATVTDENNIPVTSSNAAITFVLTGSAGGTLVGSSPVNAVGGEAGIVYQAGTQTGIATVTATSASLSPGNVDIAVSQGDTVRPRPPGNFKAQPVSP